MKEGRMMDQHNQPTAREWSQCPFCKGQGIEGNSVQVEGAEAWQAITCQRCEGTWTDVYEAANRINLEPGADVTDTVYALAMIGIESDLDGNVVNITVIPSEGSAGYNPPRLSPDVWDAVSTYFIDNFDPISKTIPLKWEG